MLALVLVMLAGPGPSLGDDIAACARSRLGQKVGNGECTSLAVEALRHCGARQPDPAAGVWGQPLSSLRDVQPGDIVQLEGAVFVQQRARDGGGVITRTTRYPHHTPVVERVRKRGSDPVLVILHQNARAAGSAGDELKIVRQGTFDLATKRAGKITAYRALATRPEQPADERRRP